MATAYSDFTVIPNKGIYNTIKCNQGDKKVVLKALRPQFANQSKYQALQRRELAAGKKVDSQYVVKYLGEDDIPEYGHVIINEYIDARTLEEYIAEKHSSDECLDMIERIAEAVENLHQLNLVDGVLNPYTVLVTRQGDRPVIAEFRGTFNNTVQEPTAYQKYISPEQKDGTITVDRRTDIFSLGVLMRDMGLSLSHDEVIKKCCAIGRTDRYYNLDEFKAALHHSHHHSEIKVNKQALSMLGLGAVIIAAVWLVIANFDNITSLFENEDNTEQVAAAPSDSTATADAAMTTADANAVSDTPAETAPVANPAGPATDFVSIVTPNIKSVLDKVYAPYIAERTSGMTAATFASRQHPLRRQVKAAYKQAIVDLGKVTNDERAKFDEIFAEYNKQKQQEFASCAPLK